VKNRDLIDKLSINLPKKRSTSTCCHSNWQKKIECIS